MTKANRRSLTNDKVGQILIGSHFSFDCSYKKPELLIHRTSVMISRLFSGRKSTPLLQSPCQELSEKPIIPPTLRFRSTKQAALFALFQCYRLSSTKSKLLSTTSHQTQRNQPTIRRFEIDSVDHQIASEPAERLSHTR